MECNKNKYNLVEKLVDCGSKQIKKFINNENSKEDSRDHFKEKSWQHCYEIFQKYFKNKVINEQEEDFLELNLGFYLASFGMYRSSGFLIDYDYKIHKNVITKLYEKKEKVISGDFINYDTYNNLKKIISESYEIYAKQSGNIVTETLATKILLGVFSCIPAFDENLKRVLKEVKNAENQLVTSPYEVDEWINSL